MTKLADVFIQPARSINFPTTPGRVVRIVAGHGQVFDGRDMPHILEWPEAHVIPTAEGMSWAPEWLSSTRQIKADVEWPEGYTVEHHNQDEWSMSRPDSFDVAAAVAESPELASPTQPTTAKSMLDILLGGGPIMPEQASQIVPPQPMIPNHQPDCRCGRCVRLRKKAAA